MIFTLKNKKIPFIKKEEEYFLDDKKINLKYCLLVEASLTKEFAYLIVVSDKIYNLKSQSWLKKQTDKENDNYLVDELNSSFNEFNPVVLNNPITGILPTKVEATEFYHHDGHLFCPQINFDYKLSSIEVIFLERLTSYTRSFDLTIVQKDLKRVHITCIPRKTYLKSIKDIFSKYAEIVETGPDPVEWNEAIDDFKKGKPWNSVYVLETEEDESDEWQPGETDESDDSESEYEYEELIPVMPEEKKRKLDESWDSKAKILDSNDYDKWEKKQKII